MSKGKTKKYTLIDGFDKLDLSPFTKQKSLALTKFIASAVKKGALDYKFLPRSLDYKFLPDLFRFLVGRQFHLVKPLPGRETQWTLAPPPSQQIAGSSVEFKTSDAPKINLLDAQQIIDTNFANFSASFKFTDYFTNLTVSDDRTHQPWWGLSNPNIPPEAPTDSFLRWDKTTQAVKDFFIEWQEADTSYTTPEGLSAHAFRGHQFQGPSDKPSAELGIMPLSTLSVAPYNEQAKGNIHIVSGLTKALYDTGAYWNQTTKTRAQTFFFRMIYQLMFPMVQTMDEVFASYPFHTYFVADFNVATPFSEKSMEDEHTVARNVKVTPYYNFYNELFELSPQNVVSEWQLPNPYVYNAYKSSPKSTSGYFHQLIDLGNKTPISKDKLTVKDYVKLTRNSSVWIEEGKPFPYSDLHPFSSLGALPYRTAARFDTIVLTDKGLLNSTKALKKAFPYGVEIDLGTQFSSGLMDTINRRSPTGGMANMLMTLLANNTTYYNTYNPSGGDISFAHRFVMYHDFVNFMMEDTTLDDSALQTLHNNVAMVDTQIFDLSQLLNMDSLETFNNTYGPYINDEKNVKLSNLLNIHEVKHGHADSMEVFHSALNTINDDIIEYLFNRAPSLKEAYEGKKCHTEVIAYEIVKYKYDDADGTLPGRQKKRIQSIFIPNMFDKDTPLSYLDTQVFYEQKYVYEVYAHTLVVGAVYRYNRGFPQPPPPGTQGDMYDGYISLEEGLYEYKPPRLIAPIIDPYALIVRAPYYNNEELIRPGGEEHHETFVTDKPPLPPDIAFHPYQGSANRVLMLLNQNYGQRPLIPNTQIFSTDAAKVAEYKEAQKAEAKPQGHILYKTDDNRGTYEIYRLNKKPEQWSDFRDEANVKKITLNSLKQSGTDDIISSNVTYYYFARFIDVHGNISNPTNIFSVRIVKEEASPPFMVLKPFHFKRPTAITSVPFKKYIKIALSDNLRKAVGQSAETADVAYQPLAGDAFKKYKFRITSKKTGKKIDINVDMNNQIINKFVSSNMNAVGGDTTGAPVTDPANPTGSEVYKESEGLLNNANIVNSSDTLCGD